MHRSGSSPMRDTQACRNAVAETDIEAMMRGAQARARADVMRRRRCNRWPGRAPWRCIDALLAGHDPRAFIRRRAASSIRRHRKRRRAGGGATLVTLVRYDRIRVQLDVPEDDATCDRGDRGRGADRRVRSDGQIAARSRAWPARWKPAPQPAPRIDRTYRPSCGGNVREGCSIGDETRSDGPDSALVGPSQVLPSSRPPHRAVQVGADDGCAVLSGIAPGVSGAHGHGRKRPRARTSRAGAGGRGESGASCARCSCSRRCGTLPPLPPGTAATDALARRASAARRPRGASGRGRRGSDRVTRSRSTQNQPRIAGASAPELGRRARLDRARQASRIAFLPGLSLGAQAARGRTHRLVDGDVPGPGVLVRPASRCTICQRSGLVRSDRRAAPCRAATAATECSANTRSAERRRSTSVQAACAATSPAPRSGGRATPPCCAARPAPVCSRRGAADAVLVAARRKQGACSPSDAPRSVLASSASRPAGHAVPAPDATVRSRRSGATIDHLLTWTLQTAGSCASPAPRQPAMPRSARRAGAFGPTLAVSAYAGGAGRLAGSRFLLGPEPRQADDDGGPGRDDLGRDARRIGIAEAGWRRRIRPFWLPVDARLSPRGRLLASGRGLHQRSRRGRRGARHVRRRRAAPQVGLSRGSSSSRTSAGARAARRVGALKRGTGVELLFAVGAMGPQATN